MQTGVLTLASMSSRVRVRRGAMRDGRWYWMGLVAGVTLAMSSALAAMVDMATATSAEHQRHDAVELVVDEIFHVVQAKRYCAGRWDEWDDKITTLPGMYVMSASISLIAAALLRSSNTQDSPLFCSPTALRWTVNVPAHVQSIGTRRKSLT